MHPEPRFSHNWLIKKLVNDQVRKHLPRLSGQVVDLGCGVRPYQADVLAHADQCIGVDWSLSIHGRNADVIADLNMPLPFASSSFDHAISFEVLEHIPEPAALLNEAFRVIKPGGSLLLSVPFQWWVHEAPWDYYRFTCHGLNHMLVKAGFSDVDIHPTSGFWTMLVLKLNYQSARFTRGAGVLPMVLRLAFAPAWWLGQVLAPLLDRLWREQRETVGYFAAAVKPRHTRERAAG